MYTYNVYIHMRVYYMLYAEYHSVEIESKNRRLLCNNSLHKFCITTCIRRQFTLTVLHNPINVSPRDVYGKY